MQGDITYRFTAHPLTAGGFYISVSLETEASLPSGGNTKSSPSTLASAKTNSIVDFLQRGEQVAGPPNSLQEKKPVPHHIANEHGISSMLAAGDPLTIGPGFRMKERDSSRSGIPMGRLTLRSSPVDKPIREVVSSSHVEERFEIVYRRSVSASESAKQDAMRADDAAMIARVLLLAKIATSRLEMRAVLREAASYREALEHSKHAMGLAAGTPATRAKAWEDMKQLLVTLREKQHLLGSHHGASLSKRILFENRLAGFVKEMHGLMEKHKPCVYGVGGGSVLFATIWIWLPFSPKAHHLVAAPMGWALVSLLTFGAILLLLNALNLKTLELRIEELLHEWTMDQLNVTLVSLVQTNANVAAINVVPKPVERFPSELLLHEMDRSLQVKERLVSIEGVIKAREHHLTSNLKHLEAHRDRVRRSIIAAGSGIFVGFFTYEVGESVMEYLHISHKQDSKAMLYWLMARRGETVPAASVSPQSGPGTVSEPEPAQHGHGRRDALTSGEAAGSASAGRTTSVQTVQKTGQGQEAPPAGQHLKGEHGSKTGGKEKAAHPEGAEGRGKGKPPVADERRADERVLSGKEWVDGKMSAAKHETQEFQTPVGSTHAPGKASGQHEIAHGIALDPVFAQQFHTPELYAHSWLLTVTILVSVLTAWIAIRKPPAEQGGGHGHH